MGHTTINIMCVDQTLQLTNSPVLASGGVKVDRINFSFCPLWEGLTKTAVFYRSTEEVYHVLLSGDSCTIPAEVLVSPGVLYIGVMGVDSNGVTRPTAVLPYVVRQGAITEGVEPAEPTPDIYEQILAELADIRQHGIAGPPGPQGEPGKNGEPGADGKSAYQIAVDHGFEGTEAEWLASLKGDGADLPSALPNPHRLKFTGAVNAEYDGSAEIEIEIPAGGSGSSVPGGAVEDCIEVVDNIEEAVNDVVYVVGEEADGDISDVLADYQRKPETVRIMYIKLDDGDATPSESWSSDSACIMTRNANIMVDFGRIQDYDRIKSALLENGVTRLDYIFLSHYHHDHCGCKNSNKAGSMSNAEAAGTSLTTLWADADIDTSNCVIVLPADAPTSLTSGDEPAWVKRVITSLINNNGITAAVPSIEGGYWSVDRATLGEAPEWVATKPKGGVIIRAHNCTAEQLTAYSSHGDYNECSTVLEVELGHTLATFTGDSSHTAQEVLCDRLRITDILKLGHHQTDAEWYQPFYERVNPRYAIASVDQDVYERYMANLVPTQASYMRPAVTWLAGKKIPFYPLPVSGTCIFESDGRTFELISNNRNYQPAAIGGAMLKTVPDGIGVDGVIDMTGTGWENYNLFNIQMLTSADGSVGTAIIAAKITAAGVTFIRGIGGTGSSDGLATYHCDLQKSETTDEFTVVYCARMVHKSGGNHATQTQHEVLAIYGIC